MGRAHGCPLAACEKSTAADRQQRPSRRGKIPPPSQAGFGVVERDGCQIVILFRLANW